MPLLEEIQTTNCITQDYSGNNVSFPITVWIVPIYNELGVQPVYADFLKKFSGYGFETKCIYSKSVQLV